MALEGRMTHLSVLVEGISNILSWNQRFDVLVLHLLDDLQSVLCHGAEWSQHTAVLHGPTRKVSVLINAYTHLPSRTHQVGPMKVMKLGISGTISPR